MKILVVDDDHEILKLTKKFLQIHNYEVECCDNALDAIQLLSDMSFDILITDATMPAYSGFDLIRTVRKTGDLNYLTIAMLTGLSEKSDIERALDLGVQDYIVKPLSPLVFMEKVEKLVKIHHAKKQQKPEKVQVNAEMRVPIKVLRITDIGVSIVGPYPISKDTVVAIDLPILKEKGIELNQFKVLYNNKHSGNSIVTELILLGATPEEQKILIQLAEGPSTKKGAA